MLNASQNRMNRAALTDALISSTPASDGRLIRHDPDAVAAQVREADDDVAGEVAVHLDELAVIDHAPDHLVHVVRLGLDVGHDVEQRLVAPVARDRALFRGAASSRLFDGMNRNSSRIVRGTPTSSSKREVRDARGRAVGVGAAELSMVTSSCVTVFTTSGRSRTCTTCRAP